jgi:hypothetical protein
LRRWQALQQDITLAEEQLAVLLTKTPGQILTSLPGVAVVRAAAFSAYTLPIERWETPEYLYSATALRRRAISPPRLPDVDGSAARDNLIIATAPNQPAGPAAAAEHAPFTDRHKYGDHAPRRSLTHTITLDARRQS